VPTEVQVKLQHDYVRLLDRSSRWLVQQAPDSLDVDSGIEMYGKVVESLRSRVPDLVDGYDAETCRPRRRTTSMRACPRSSHGGRRRCSMSSCCSTSPSSRLGRTNRPRT